VEEGGTTRIVMGEGLGTCTIRGSTDPGARITISPEFEWTYRELRARADPTGAFSIRGLAPGRHEFRTRTEQYGSDSIYHGGRARRIEVSPDGTWRDSTD